MDEEMKTESSCTVDNAAVYDDADIAKKAIERAKKIADQRRKARDFRHKEGGTE